MVGTWNGVYDGIKCQTLSDEDSLVLTTYHLLARYDGASIISLPNRSSEIPILT
jgi:hypothetical protein